MKRGPTDCTHEHEYAASKNLYMYSLLSITSLQIILCKGNAILAIMQIIWVLIRLFICSFSSFAPFIPMLRNSLHFFSRWSQSRMRVYCLNPKYFSMVSRMHVAPSEKNMRRLPSMSLFSRRNAMSSLKALSIPTAVSVYCFPSDWMCITVFYSTPEFQTGGARF